MASDGDNTKKQMPELSIFSSEIVEKRNWVQPLLIKEVAPKIFIFRVV